jgi:lysosomal acid lipase/cholesteryl ester hydrolase
MTTLLSFNILVVVSIGAHIAKKSNPFHKEPARAVTEKEWETRISGERFSSRTEYYANFFGYEVSFAALFSPY